MLNKVVDNKAREGKVGRYNSTDESEQPAWTGSGRPNAMESGAVVGLPGRHG